MWKSLKNINKELVESIFNSFFEDPIVKFEDIGDLLYIV